MPGEREAVADLDALHRLDAHQRRGEPCVEPVVLARVRAEARRHAGRAHLDDAAERVAVLARLVDRRRDPRPLRAARGPSTAMPMCASSAFATAPAATCTAVWRADARSSASRTSGSSYFCTPARSAWPGRGSVTAFTPLPFRLALGRPRAHPPRPVLVVAVADDERERRAERPAAAEAREHLDLVRLDLLARRAAVALLPPAEVGVDRLAVEHEPGRQARQDRHERGPVRLPCRCELERHADKPRAARITLTGAGTPVQRSKLATPCRTRASRPSMTAQPAARAAAHERRVAVAVRELDDRLTGVRLDEQLVAHRRRVDDQVAAVRVGRPRAAPRELPHLAAEPGQERRRRPAGADEADALRVDRRRRSPCRC